MTANVQPLVSVRLMTYNHAPYIAQAIEGCLMQETSFPFEIVIGDDFSTDGTREICEEYAKKYPDKIRVLDRPIGGEYWEKRQRLGRIYNFFNILKNCNGKYIALLDGDDYWTAPNKLAIQIDFLEKNKNIVLCATRFNTITENGDILQSNGINEIKSIQIDDLLMTNPFGTLTIMYRNIPSTHFIDEFKHLPYFDWPLIFNICFRNSSAILANNTANYRVHNNGLYSKNNYQKMIENKTAILKYLIKKFNGKLKTIEIEKINNQIYNNSKELLFIYKKNKELSKKYSISYYLITSNLLKLKLISALKIIKYCLI